MMTRPNLHFQKSRGFTLIELVAVLVVVGIMAAFALSRMASTATFGATSLAEQLKRDIRYTQILAMSLSTNYTITITASGYAISPTPVEGVISVTAPAGVTLTPATITFNSDGAPSMPGILSITSSGGGNTRTLTVLPETGYVDG